LGKRGISQGRGKYDLQQVKGIGLEDEAIQFTTAEIKHSQTIIP